MMRPTDNAIHRRPPRAVALLAVLIVVTIGALVGASLLYAAEAGRESAAASLRTEQSRLLAWSGVQAVMAELASQRDLLLRGESPDFTTSWVFADEQPRSGPATAPRYAFRLRAIGGSEPASETGRLDLNHATAEMLAKLPGMSEALAQRIVAARPFASVHDLLGVEGVTEQLLFGGAESALSEDQPADFPDAAPTHLAALVTVFSFDPNIQAGVGERGPESAGERRLNLNVEWSDELGEAVERRLGEGASAALKQMMTAGTKFERDADIVRQLQMLNVPREMWGEVLDVFTTTDAEYLLGRVDVMTAPAEVLACVPGIDADAAGAIVSRRGRIEGDARATTAWLVAEGVLTPQQFAEAVDHLTARAMQHRILVEAGTIVDRAQTAADPDGLPRIGGPAEGSGDDPGDSFGSLPESAQLADRVILEAVIDVSSTRPRVAYLRDVTMLPLAGLVRRRTQPADAPPAPPRNPLEPSPEPAPDAAAPPRLPPAAPGRGPTSPMKNPDEAPDDQPAPQTPPSAPADGRIGRWTTRSGGAP